ncbi:unnamed protein product, partial [Rotaria sp. Silwood1]
MSISLLSNTYNRQNWEDSEFPILCQTCSKVKNVCQTCLLDLEF